MTFFKTHLSNLSLIFFCTTHILIFAGCTIVKYNSANQPLAKYYSFSSDTTQRYLATLDTTHLYVNGQEMVRTYQSGKVEKVFNYMFLKFSGNGMAFYSSDSKEKFTEKNIYAGAGQYCFYKIEDGEIQLEMFDYNLKKFTIMHFKVFPDKIVLYKDKLRILGGGTQKFNMVFDKTTIPYKRVLRFPD